MKLNSLVLCVGVLATVDFAIADELVEKKEESQCRADIECIVVYARFREEGLIDVPVSESYFSEDTIAELGIERVSDFIQLIPNVTIVESQNIGSSFMTIRGITQVRNGEAPIAVVIDDVLQPNSRQFRRDLIDIASIEVIKGPQGALYGRNATGGVVIINTKKPTEQTSGSLSASFGNAGQRTVKGSLRGALSDKVLYTLAAQDSEQDGDIKNHYLNKMVNYFDEQALRGSLHFNPSNNTSFVLQGYASKVEGGALNFVFQPTLYGPDGVTLAEGDTLFDMSLAGANNTDYRVTANNLGYNERDMSQWSLKLQHAFGDADLLAVTSYHRLEEFFAGDQFPYTAAITRSGLDGTQSQYADISNWSQELRLSSSYQALYWMVGAYYLQTDRFISTTTGDDRGQGIIRIQRRPEFDSAINPTFSFFGDDNDNTAWAVFGNVSYDMSDALQLSLALRYDEDQRKQTVSEFNTSATPGIVNNKDFSQWQPKVSLRYLLEKNISVFATWGKGFRSGQYNQNGVAEQAALVGLLGIKDIADAEVSSSYELGLKGYFAQQDFTLTASAFDTEVQGQHYFSFIGSIGAQILSNIDEVHLQGIELGLHKPIFDGLDFTFSLGYIDNEIARYRANPALEGNKAPYVPKATLNLALDYHTELTQTLGLQLRADYEYRGRQYWSVENSSARDAITLVNLRAGVVAIDDSWSIMASVKNAFDEKYNEEYVSVGFAHPTGGQRWLVDFNYKF